VEFDGGVGGVIRAPAHIPGSDVYGGLHGGADKKMRSYNKYTIVTELSKRAFCTLPLFSNASSTKRRLGRWLRWPYRKNNGVL
jgi:hypothetical protein